MKKLLLITTMVTASALAAPPPLPKASVMPVSVAVPATGPQSTQVYVLATGTNEAVTIQGSIDLTNWMFFGSISSGAFLHTIDDDPAEYFRGEITSESVSLTWIPSSDPWVAGYNIYCGSQSNVYTQEMTVNDVTNCVMMVTNVAPVLYFSAMAFTTNGSISCYCKPAIKTNLPPILTITNQAP